MNAKELAKILGVHPETVRKMIREGEIKAVKEGRSYIIPKSEVKRLKQSKGIEELAIAQERATMQLIVNIDSEIDAELSNIQRNAEFLKGYMKASGIKSSDYSLENYERRRKLYEEDKSSPLLEIISSSNDIARLEYLKKELQIIAKDHEDKNTFEKANKHWNDFFNQDPIEEMLKRLEGEKNDKT